jgi:hypothetical protein
MFRTPGCVHIDLVKTLSLPPSRPDSSTTFALDEVGLRFGTGAKLSALVPVRDRPEQGRFLILPGNFCCFHLPKAHYRANILNYLHKSRNGLIIAPLISQTMFNHNPEPSPMWIHEGEQYVEFNWIAVVSYTASLALSLAIWRGLFIAVERLLR